MTLSEFSQHIFALRRMSGISRPAFSEKWGYHVNTIKSYEKQGRLPPIDYIAALSIEAEADFTTLVNLLLSVGPLSQGEHKTELRHLLDNQASLISERSARYDKGENALNFTMQSDAMRPSIVKGASVNYQAYRDINQLKDGCIVLLDIEQTIIIRRLQITTDNRYILSCDNESYDTKTYNAEEFKALSIIGVAISTLNPL